MLFMTPNQQRQSIEGDLLLHKITHTSAGVISVFVVCMQSRDARCGLDSRVHAQHLSRCLNRGQHRFNIAAYTQAHPLGPAPERGWSLISTIALCTVCSCEMLGVDWAAQKRAESPDESSDYSPDVSPVMLAAHCNQFEILQLLLSRGARIVRPHPLTCSCPRCRRENSEDSLRHSLLRIHTYRALSSPAWISLTSADPVLTAFRLSYELDHLAMRENEFKVRTLSVTFNRLAGDKSSGKKQSQHS